LEKIILEAAFMIQKALHVIAFTGAGISVESGIPDFRSKGGLWERYDPNEYAEYHAFLQTPEKFWTMHSELSDMVINAQPNPAHQALAALEKKGKLKAIITQNIDFLHQRAGNTKVLELHGSGETVSCLECGKTVDGMIVHEIVKSGTIPPRCDYCNGLIKPNVILFSEPLPNDVFEEARRQMLVADLLIIVGSSLSVYPAAALPILASQTKTKIIIVNDEPTQLDQIAHIVINGKAGKILPKIIDKVMQSLNLERFHH
jgi:NAD-dependent deacetylase